MSTRIRAMVVSVLLTLSPALATAAEPVVELPTLGGAHAQAEDINDLGQIVGWSALSDGRVEATIWTAEGPRSLGRAPGTDFSFAAAINNLGAVAGHSELGTIPGDTSNTRTATFWGPDGVIDIGAAMRFGNSTGYDINDNGIVALKGDHPEPLQISTGWVWSTETGGIQAGPDLLYRFGGNHGINNSNDVVGYGAAGLDGAQAILARYDAGRWEPGVEIGLQAVRAPTSANAISDSGIIVGQGGDDGVHSYEAAMFTLDPRKPVVWLDTLDDFEDSNPLDVNDAGLIVGYVLRFDEYVVDLRAVVWLDEQIYDLNHLLRPNSSFRVLISATGVNANGDVVGYGRLLDGSIRPFLIREVGQGPTSGLFGHPGTPADLR